MIKDETNDSIWNLWYRINLMVEDETDHTR